MSSKVKQTAKVFADLTPFTYTHKNLNNFTLRQTLVLRRGVNHAMAKKIMEHCGYSYDFKTRFGNMRSSFITRRMNQFFEQYDRYFDEKLMQKVREDVKRYIRIGARRGQQHKDRLPVNGQHSKKAKMRKKFKYF